MSSKSKNQSTENDSEVTELVFNSEEEFIEHFRPQIESIEKFYAESVSETDIPPDQSHLYDEYLRKVLEDPDEIWEDDQSTPGLPLHVYISQYKKYDDTVYYLAIAVASEDEASFVLFHFPTKDPELVKKYQTGEMIFSRSDAFKEAEDLSQAALKRGDKGAKELYDAMIRVRQDDDIKESEFKDYLELRDEVLEEPDEIWKRLDQNGGILVTYIKAYHEENDTHYYLVLTQADEFSASHYLLFSFPTRDTNLVERYRVDVNIKDRDEHQRGH
jgi:hypothetical protein